MKKILFIIFLALLVAFVQALIGQGYDSESPTVTISAPTAGQQFAAGTTSITMQYSATDAGGGSIAKYWVRKGSDSWINNSLNTSYDFTGLSAGTYTFYVIATDDSDNNSTTASVSATILSTTTPPGGEQTCAQKGGSVCSASQNCSGSIVSASDTSSCCIGGCAAKSCTQLGGITCDLNSSDCTNWINQSTGCCSASACTPKITSTILCSFQTYLSNEPITAVFIEPSSLERTYDFNIAGSSLTISPSLANDLADTIVIQYPELAAYLIASNLTSTPQMTAEQAYLIELLKNKTLYGTSSYSARAESFQTVYELIDSSRLRWWNAENDDTCEPKLTPGDLGISLQTMHYFRINNLWLLWNEELRKRQ